MATNDDREASLRKRRWKDVSAERSRIMASVRSKNTKPEMIVRQFLHRTGFRYRLHVKSLPGSPDLVFPSRKKIVLVNGCFWHGHTDVTCKLARLPKTRREFWSSKVQKNAARDRRAVEKLTALGWEVLTVWECQLIPKTRQDTLRKISEFLMAEK